MKVLYVIDTLAIGGAELSTIQISANLPSFEALVCYIYGPRILEQKALESGARVRGLDCPGKYNWILAATRLTKLMREERPDIVVATLLRSELICRVVCLYLGVPIVGTLVNDGLAERGRAAKKGLVPLLKYHAFRWLRVLSGSICCGFISNSQGIIASNARELKLSKERITVIYRGREMPVVQHPRPPLGDHISVLACGRLVEEKGIDYLIRAFQDFCKVRSGYRLIIAGDGPLLEELRGLVSSRGLSDKIVFLGFVHDISALMQSVDCLVFPSLREGFSGVLIEAMMHGLPILASDIPPNIEAISHLETGFLFRKGDAGAILSAFFWLDDNKILASRLGRTARLESIRRFEIKTIAKEHENLYRRIIAEKTKDKANEC